MGTSQTPVKELLYVGLAHIKVQSREKSRYFERCVVRVDEAQEMAKDSLGHDRP